MWSSWGAEPLSLQLLVMRGTFGTLRNEDGKMCVPLELSVARRALTALSQHGTRSDHSFPLLRRGVQDRWQGLQGSLPPTPPPAASDPSQIQDPMPYADYLAHFGPPPSSALNVTPNPSLAPPQRTAPPTQRVQVPHAVSRFKPLVVRPSQKIEPAKERDVEMENSPPPRKAEKRPRSESMESERMESPRPSQRRGVESDPAGGDEDAEMEVKAVKVDKGNGKEVQKTRGLVPMVRPGAVEAVVEESHYYLVRIRCSFLRFGHKADALSLCSASGSLSELGLSRGDGY